MEEENKLNQEEKITAIARHWATWIFEEYIKKYHDGPFDERTTEILLLNLTSAVRHGITEARVDVFLPPIPQDNLIKFIDKQAEIMCNFRSAPKVFRDYRLAVSFMLRAYDELKSGK